ncbi:MAG: YopX family protein [Campylobacteraceae bacterium]|jgi:uncharacterized phage protein (TIGR01671 family)|nr:YopX family protein [Campylobacteraceae bacterium]
MREIKFRAWDIMKNEMFRVDAIIFNDKTLKDDAHILDEKNDIHYFGDIWLMQYVGLKDKNGKEIYDGDILNVANRSINCVFLFNIKKVEYSKVNFTLPYFCWDKECNHKSHWSHYCEVIGNIYENPELLEEK